MEREEQLVSGAEGAAREGAGKVGKDWTPRIDPQLLSGGLTGLYALLERRIALGYRRPLNARCFLPSYHVTDPYLARARGCDEELLLCSVFLRHTVRGPSVAPFGRPPFGIHTTLSGTFRGMISNSARGMWLLSLSLRCSVIHVSMLHYIVYNQ